MRWLLLLTLLGCSFDPHRAGLRCEDDAECGSTLVCVSGLCQAGEGLPPIADGLPPRPDATLDAAPPPDDAAGPVRDAARPMDAAPRVRDRGVPPPTPDAAPPPQDAHLPPPPPDLGRVDMGRGDPGPGPAVGLPGCRADAWCVYAVADAYIAEDDPARGHGGIGDPLIVSRTPNNRLVSETLLRFGMGVITGRRLRSARLYLRVDSANLAPRGEEDFDDPELKVGAVDPEWLENTVNWNNQPMRRRDMDVVADAPSSPGIIAIDVTRLVGSGREDMIPPAVSLRVHNEGSAGGFFFRNRESGALVQGDDVYPPRLELDLEE